MKNLAAAIFTLLTTISPALADAVDEMIATDRAFALMAADKGVPAAFSAYASVDVRMFPDGGQPYAGRDELIKRFSKWPEGAEMKWDPVEGMAAPGGDFGFTWGRYVFSQTKEDGSEFVEHGKYVSIWRKEDGAWKFVADIGNANPAPNTAD